MVKFTGTIEHRPFGCVEEIFIGNAEKPFLPVLQQILRQRGKKATASIRLGDSLIVEGALDLFVQHRHEGLHNQDGGVNVLDRRFKVGDVDVLPFLQPGVRIDLNLS